MMNDDEEAEFLCAIAVLVGLIALACVILGGSGMVLAYLLLA